MALVFKNMLCRQTFLNKVFFFSEYPRKKKHFGAREHAVVDCRAPRFHPLTGGASGSRFSSAPVFLLGFTGTWIGADALPLEETSVPVPVPTEPRCPTRGHAFLKKFFR